jgi:hypothetical protein
MPHGSTIDTCLLLTLATLLVFTSISYTTLVKWSILPVMIHNWLITTLMTFVNPIISVVILMVNLKWYYAILAFAVILIASNILAPPFVRLVLPREYESMFEEEVKANISSVNGFIFGCGCLC